MIIMKYIIKYIKLPCHLISDNKGSLNQDPRSKRLLFPVGSLGRYKEKNDRKVMLKHE